MQKGFSALAIILIIFGAIIIIGGFFYWLGTQRIVVHDATKPAVTLLSPNGGEKLQIGDKYLIKWSSSGIKSSDKVSIFLQTSEKCPPLITGCQTSFSLPSDFIENTGSYLWDTNKKMGGGSTGPNSIDVVPGSDYRILICKGDICDASDNYFTITSVSAQPSITVTSPNGGEVWKQGITHNITWSDNVTTSDNIVKIILETINGEGIGIVYQGQDTGLYTWTAQMNIGMGHMLEPGNYKIHMCKGNVCDKSDNYFTIVAQ